jgi:energy-coupling factor transport system substrate-specific component
MKLSIRELTLIGMMTALIELCKLAFAFLPNVELTSFWIILFTLFFGWRILFVIPVMILIEGLLYGFGIWWVTYLYLWPLLALVTWCMRKQANVFFWSILSGLFGLFFGFFAALPYVVIGAVNGDLRAGFVAGFTWWVAGIPWDMVHGVSNFVLMLLLFVPIRQMLGYVKTAYEKEAEH